MFNIEYTQAYITGGWELKTIALTQIEGADAQMFCLPF